MPVFSLIRSSVLTFALLAISGCTFQPLYGSADYSNGQGSYALSQVSVANVDTRVGQQVRNHLIFLLQGGRDNNETRYLVRLRVVSNDQRFTSVQRVRDRTAGNVTVRVSYELRDKFTYTRIADGNRVAVASYDRTEQSFANSRAVRDAENRAAKEAAEQVRLALAADLRS